MHEEQPAAGPKDGAYEAGTAAGPSGEAEEAAGHWQTDEDRRRAKEENRARLEERNRAQRQAEWERFIETQHRDLELRGEGQLAEALGEPLPGEHPEALRRLAREDRRQAQEGLVALMSGGSLHYKHLEELTPEDMPARAAADRLRETWLKKRHDGWLARGEGSV